MLSKNGIFLISEQGFEYTSNCHGIWKRLSKDTILLKCDSEKNPVTMLQSGYMSERTQKAIILNHNQIRIKNIILTKSKK
jgi:hypothetical protein